MFKVVILILVLIAATSKSTNKKSAVFNVQHIQLPLNQTKPYVFKNIDQTKALMINVEIPKQPTKFNDFLVTISDNKTRKTQCHFKYMNNLCVEERPSQQTKVVVQCLSDKCDFKLVFSQRIIIRSGDSTSFKKKLTTPGEIYQLNKRKYNTILEIYAERDEHQLLSDQITVFSNIHAFPLHQTEQLDQNSAIFGLKPVRNDQDQFIYIHSTSNKSEHFKMWLRSHNGQLRDSISVIDFIQNYGKHSGNKYTFMGEFKRNVQVNVRVFSPKDPKAIPLTLKVLGKTPNATEQQKEIRKLKFDTINFQGQRIFDFSFAITHKVHSQYKTVAFEIFLGEIEDKSLFFEIEVRDLEAFQVNIFDHIYFGCLAKQELQFTVEPQVKMELADGDKDIQISTNAKQKYFSNIQSCSLHKGCNIQIKAENQCLDCSFKFNLKDEDIKNHIIYYQVQDNQIQGKVEISEQIYFKYAMNGMAATQIIVNSKNVIIYANFQNYKRCKVPKASCHQYAINQQNPMVVHNLEEKPSELVIVVVGLEKTSFKARFINQLNGLQVQLGQKFSYLMDDEEKSLQIRIQVKSEDFGDSQHLHFNLISPIHSLRMKVANDQQQVQSLQGYITFDRKEITGDLFVVTIQKINLYYDQFVHFTFIVTTSDVPVKLDATSTHYERYNPKSEKKFIIQYEPSISNALNIYTQNLEKERTSMVIHVVNTKLVGEQGQAKPIFSKQLVRDYEFIDLDRELEQLEICDDSNCELEIWIQNEGNSTLEQSITLLEEQSVIGLDDSIWSVFQINELSKNNHFYFVPRKQNKSINIIFNTDDTNLFINYRIYNTTNSINPADWPFGHQETDSKHTASTQQINIQANDPEVLDCWPTCAILININQILPEGKSDNSVIKSYKILATNSIIELPEDTKLDFTLRNQEEKVLFIVAKSIITYSKLTFFTYYSLGRAKITASLTSGDREFKLQNLFFQDLETVLEIEKIKAIITKQSLNIETVLVKITILAETNLKMTLQYSSLIKDIYRLRMDDLEVAAMAKGNQIWYEFVPQRDFSLKLYRVKGFPLFKVIKCNESDYIGCLNKNKKYIEMKTTQFVSEQDKIKNNLQKEQAANIQSSEKPYLEVFVEKAYEYSDEQCERCIFFLWVYCFQGDLQLTINLRTKLSQIELKEMSILNDRIDSGQHNKYLINVPHDQDALVTLRVMQGTARVVIVKNSLTLYNETHQTQNNNLVQVTINAEEQEQQEQKPEDKQSSVHFGKVKKFNDQHLFGHAHVTVTALSQLPVQLLISYSVGGSSVYLQDGIVVQKQMVPNVVHTFFYRNRNKKNKAYLTLSSEIESFENVSISKELLIKFYYYPDAFDRTKKESFQPELPPNRNENYLGSTISHVYQMPGKFQLYEIKIESQSYVKITASINHEEVVYLPLGFDYLIKLHPRQELNLVVDSPTTEFLEVVIKKCDATIPTLLYTNDAREFKKGIFEAEVQIDNNIYKQFINTKKNSSTIHLKFKATRTTESLFTVSVSSSSRQMRQNMISYKPGNKGIVNYKMIDVDTVEIQFKPILCNDKQCQVPFDYYLLVAQNLGEIYTDLNCANTYFIPMAQTLLSKSKKEIKVVDSKHYDKKKNEYRYRVKLQKQSAFIGIKGVIDQTTEQVQYTPLQIRSFWGELSNVSFGIILTVSLVLALLVTVVIVVSTKLARRGYKPISGDE